MPIKRISQQTVSSLSSIASVFNVTSVVKELIDNSLDADSSHINIEVDYETGGLRHCLVRDNGCGVTKLDRPLMCCNCTTSKLSSNSEITKKSIFANVSTLGFRGEALFFISQLISVSDNRSGSRSGSRNGSMTITTRTAKDQMGEMWSIMGQGLPDGLPKSVAAAIGTCITLEGLFSSSVVRKKLLMRQSRKTIEDIRKLIISYAMTYPELRFTFKLMEVKTNGEICISSHNNKNGLIINPCSSQLSLLSQQYQIRNPKNSFFEGEIETETKNCHNIQGEEEEVEYKLSYVLPLMNGTSEASSKNSNTFLAVNNRPLDLKSSVLFKEIRNMLNSVYEKLNLLRPNIWILNIIILNNENLDVNIEPAKNDVLIFKQKEFLRILENELHVIVANNHGLNYSDEFSNRIGKNKIKETENEEALDDSKYVVFRGSDSGSANSLKGPNDEFEISNEIADDETSNLNAIEISNDQDGKDWSFHTHDFFSQELIGNGDEIHSEARDGTPEHEDLTIANDISLSNPFALLKSNRRVVDEDNLSAILTTPNTSIFSTHNHNEESTTVDSEGQDDDIEILNEVNLNDDTLFNKSWRNVLNGRPKSITKNNVAKSKNKKTSHRPFYKKENSNSITSNISTNIGTNIGANIANSDYNQFPLDKFSENTFNLATTLLALKENEITKKTLCVFQQEEAWLGQEKNPVNESISNWVIENYKSLVSGNSTITDITYSKQDFIFEKKKGGITHMHLH